MPEAIMPETITVDGASYVVGKDVLKTNTVADMLNVSALTVIRWRSQNRGPIKPMRIGGHVYYLRREVEAEAQRRKGATAE